MNSKGEKFFITPDSAHLLKDILNFWVDQLQFLLENTFMVDSNRSLVSKKVFTTMFSKLHKLKSTVYITTANGKEIGQINDYKPYLWCLCVGEGRQLQILIVVQKIVLRISFACFFRFWGFNLKFLQFWRDDLDELLVCLK